MRTKIIKNFISGSTYLQRSHKNLIFEVISANRVKPEMKFLIIFVLTIDEIIADLKCEQNLQLCVTRSEENENCEINHFKTNDQFAEIVIYGISFYEIFIAYTQWISISLDRFPFFGKSNRRVFPETFLIFLRKTLIIRKSFLQQNAVQGGKGQNYKSAL